MKLSYNWLKQYIDFDLKPEELSTLLTDIGLEVEGLQEFQSIRGGLEGVVVGEVKSCLRHPNADKLSLTRVDVGKPDLLSIVCGAPNVAEGQKVLVATVGTTLYQGEQSFEIKKARIRGEESQGMICAEDELGLGDSHEGIMVLPDEVGVGTPAKEYFEIENDYVFEIGLTPNRADAASHIGAARDLVAGLNRLENTRKHKLKIPEVKGFKVDNQDLDIDVIVEDPEACPRYTGVTLSNIQVKESPDWLKNKLLAIGLRPINNIVDVTNYVLHETGQPLHAFDADEIAGNRVIIKKLENGTPFITLDEEERKLGAEDLMICNDKEGMCIAGVFGGIHSGVTEKTTRLFLESAYFDPAHIRKTSRRHTLQTDASFRFERGADPNVTVYALKRAILLFQEVAGGVVSSEIKDVYPKPVEKIKVDIRFENVDRLIGNHIDRKIIREILEDLEIEVTGENETGLSLLIPTNKVDVTREADVIEEIIRIYGFNRIEYQKKFSTSVQVRQKPDRELYQNRISEQLTAQGFHEMINNSLTNASYYKSSGL
ncbi:MAG: phenylalanine--tRNA ligase subunit beta, partial [bacterium]